MLWVLGYLPGYLKVPDVKIPDFKIETEICQEFSRICWNLDFEKLRLWKRSNNLSGLVILPPARNEALRINIKGVVHKLKVSGAEHDTVYYVTRHSLASTYSLRHQLLHPKNIIIFYKNKVKMLLLFFQRNMNLSHIFILLRLP